MTQIHLSYHERICLWVWIGQHQAPRLKEAAVLLRVYEKVRPSDEEMRDTQLVLNDQGARWNPPEGEYGAKEIALEGEECTALAGVIENAPNVRVSDAAWMCRLTEQLAAKESKAIEDLKGALTQ